MQPTDRGATDASNLSLTNIGRAIENATPSRAEDLQPLLESVSSRLALPLALLSLGPSGWRFEMEAFPRKTGPDPTPFPDGDSWSGVPVGSARGFEWTLAVPGKRETWQEGNCYEQLLAAANEIRRALKRRSGSGSSTSIGGGIYGFARRLSRATHTAGIHSLILRTMARRAGARVGALAIYTEQDRALRITATYGYPSVLVEHVRIAPGEGILGGSFVRGSAEIGEASQKIRRR